MVPTLASVIFWFTVLCVFTLATAIPSYLWQRIRNKKSNAETIVIMKGHFAKNFALTKKVAFWLPKTLWLLWRIVWFIISNIPFCLVQLHYTIRADIKQSDGE